MRNIPIIKANNIDSGHIIRILPNVKRDENGGVIYNPHEFVIKAEQYWINDINKLCTISDKEILYIIRSNRELRDKIKPFTKYWSYILIDGEMKILQYGKQIYDIKYISRRANVEF